MTPGKCLSFFYPATLFSLWRRCSLLICLAILGLGLAACSSGSSTADQAKAKTTVLVYMVATDLERRFDLASMNLAEIQQVGSNDEVNLIVQLGAADKDDWRTNQRIRVIKDDIEHLDDLGTLNMTAADTLRDFITWGVQAYPAEQYMLVFWNHGGGPNLGFGPDEVYQKIDPTAPPTMSLAVMEDALKQAQDTTQAKFELIGFDACLMASVELANMLSPYANYMVASQDIEPGPGWDWEVLMNHLTQHPLSTGLETGTAIADGYVAKTASLVKDDLALLSVTDLSQVPALTQAIAAANSTLLQAIQNRAGDPQAQINLWSDIAFIRRAALDFYSPQFFKNGMDLVDVGSFYGDFRWANLLPEANRTAITQALQRAVPYQKLGTSDTISDASGLTMFFPVSAFSTEASEYRQVPSLPTDTRQLLRWFADTALNPGQFPTIELSNTRTSAGSIFSDVAQAKQMALNYAALLTHHDNTELIYALKPLDDFSQQNSHTTTIGAKISSGWFFLNNARVMMVPDEHQLVIDSGTYLIPTLRAIAKDTNGNPTDWTVGMLRVDLSPDPDDPQSLQYKVLNFLSSDTSHAARYQPLYAGDIFEPLAFNVNEARPIRMPEPLRQQIRSTSTTQPIFTITLQDLDEPNQADDITLGVMDFLGRHVLPGAK